jgi:hypothetical protein
MNGKGVSIGMAMIMALSVPITLIVSHNRDQRIGKYLAEHHCSRIRENGFDPMYACGDIEITESDILKITTN